MIAQESKYCYTKADGKSQKKVEQTEQVTNTSCEEKQVMFQLLRRNFTKNTTKIMYGQKDCEVCQRKHQSRSHGYKVKNKKAQDGNGNDKSENPGKNP